MCHLYCKTYNAIGDYRTLTLVFIDKEKNLQLIPQSLLVKEKKKENNNNVFLFSLLIYMK